MERDGIKFNIIKIKHKEDVKYVLQVGDAFKTTGDRWQSGVFIDSILKLNPKTIICKTYYGGWGNNDPIEMELKFRYEDLFHGDLYIVRNKKIYKIELD